MKLRILGDIYFCDIRRSVPLGILEEVSKAFLFFVAETRDAARRTIAFASIYDNPDYSEHSFLTPVDALCKLTDDCPCVLISIRPENCTETVALHEVMHAYLYFAEGYDIARHLDGPLPFHVKLFAGHIGNIAMDMHTNERLVKRGFAIDSLRDEYFAALEENLVRFRQPYYAEDVGMQWQVGAMWGHMLAGAQFYRPTEANLWVHRQLDGFCRRRSPGTIRFRDLLVETFQRTGYDTPEKVGRFVDEVTPKLFKALGERFRPEYLRHTHRRRANLAEHSSYPDGVSI
jgi:hypothetical protein